jgi:DNA-binding XRE family transcriptional regulator
MKEPYERLKDAREKAGFADASTAARALGVREPTYFAHENGSRGFKSSADEYARKYGVSLEWLLTGRGSRERRSIVPVGREVPLVGYVSAGAEAHFFSDQGELGRVTAPEGATDSTVAVEIRGESLGSFFDHWIVFYDDVRRPVTADLVGKLCVLGLDDGRVLIKKLKRSRTRGLFHLLSQTEDPILDVAIEWAAKVKTMVPR